MVSTSRVLVAIVEICLEAKNWSALNEHIVLLSKRRSQLKQAVTKMVQECCTYVDKTPDKETMIKLIETLRSVTEGKVKHRFDKTLSQFFLHRPKSFNRETRVKDSSILNQIFFKIFQIYVEVERARLTHRLAKLKEEDGDVTGAATAMQELQVNRWTKLNQIS